MLRCCATGSVPRFQTHPPPLRPAPLCLPAGWHSTVVTVAPISRFHSGGAALEFAPIGLSNMLNGGGAVRGLHAEPRGKATGELLVSLTVRGRGTLLAYSSLKPQVGRRHQGHWLAFSKTTALGACLPGLRPHCCGTTSSRSTSRPVPGRHAPPPCLQACAVDGFEVPWEHVGDRLSVDVPQVGSMHAGRSEQELIITF